jgi:hypothetical protein
MKWYGTFGYGQVLAQNYVVLEAKDYIDAFSKMTKHYENLWSHLYTEGAFAGQAERYGLTEVPLGTPNARKSDVPVELKIDDAAVQVTAVDQDIKFTHAVIGNEDGPIAEFNFTTNEFGVALTVGNEVIIQKPPAHSLTKQQAYELAAWLYVVARAIPGDLEFEDVVNAVEEQNAF